MSELRKTKSLLENKLREQLPLMCSANIKVFDNDIDPTKDFLNPIPVNANQTTTFYAYQYHKPISKALDAFSKYEQE